ncbi:MAG: IS3 family transposase, partial [Desulfuromonas sp.]|nr:IS3 family transposase [Desulfuromonas sp.]
KKSDGILREGRQVKYALIKSCRYEFRVVMMCRVLSVSRAGFYAWLKRPASPRDQRRSQVGVAVESTFRQFKQRYGAPRLTVELNANGVPCCKNHVASLLKERGLRARNGKRFRAFPHVEAKTNVTANVLRQQFAAPAPNMKWVSDITYIKAGRTWMYLAAVMDLFSRKIVGWALDSHMRESLVLEALDTAMARREAPPGLLLHSDRGVQYRGNEYQEALKNYGIGCSMSRKGNCWDNAAMESFFSRFKVELIYAEHYRTTEDARTGIFEYIEMFYNRKRRHSSLGYVSPHEYERQFEPLTVSTCRG